MRYFCALFTAVLAVVALAPAGVSAQPLASASGPVPGLDVATLTSDGWTEEQPDFWTREVRPGVVQRLAFGAGRVELIPELQAELDLLVERIAVEPSAELFAAIDELSGTLANLTGFDQAFDSQVIQKIGPCDPQTINKGAYASVFPPGTGWRYMLVNSSGYWDDPSGLPCNGHVYARSEYNLYSAGTGPLSDFQYCVDSDNFSGGCGEALFDPNWGSVTYTSCDLEGYAYLNVLNGALVLTQSASTNSC